MFTSHVLNEDPRKRDNVGRYYLAVFKNGRPLLIGALNGSTEVCSEIAQDIARDHAVARRTTLLRVETA